VPHPHAQGSNSGSGAAGVYRAYNSLNSGHREWIVYQPELAGPAPAIPGNGLNPIVQPDLAEDACNQRPNLRGERAASVQSAAIFSTIRAAEVEQLCESVDHDFGDNAPLQQYRFLRLTSLTTNQGTSGASSG